jgi:hypothetical protein
MNTNSNTTKPAINTRTKLFREGYTVEEMDEVGITDAMDYYLARDRLQGGPAALRYTRIGL